ncbi:hypothetical protein FKP32DRAFT_1671664 [Trametes sanguinea]|nr:hypothetical protein FKP32DRAFT_1671664 [Trametes sanguinea]
MTRKSPTSVPSSRRQLAMRILRFRTVILIQSSCFDLEVIKHCCQTHASTRPRRYPAAEPGFVMSTFSVSEEASLIAAAVPENRVALGAVALLAYEYIITLDQEVRCIWMHKKTGAIWLFLVIRCITYVKVQTALQVAQYIIWAGLRALALSGMNLTLASAVFLLAAAPFAVNMVCFSNAVQFGRIADPDAGAQWVIGGIGTYSYNLPLAGCLVGTNETASQAKMQVQTSYYPRSSLAHFRPCSGVSISRSCVMASDVLVIAITWWYAARGRTLHDARQLKQFKHSLTQVLIMNGTIYFLALLTVNAVHLTLSMLSINGLADEISEVAVFIDPLTAILICRFLLALHSANLRLTGEELATDDSDAHGMSVDASMLNFASFVESMGGTVNLHNNMLDEEDSTQSCESVGQRDDDQPPVESTLNVLSAGIVLD